jgi:excisionase family DNA binding protein
MHDLMKPTDLARQLGVSRSWLYEAAKTGRIPSIRIGSEDGPLRFVPEDIERWINDARAAWRPGRPAVATRIPVDVVERRDRVLRTTAVSSLIPNHQARDCAPISMRADD